MYLVLFGFDIIIFLKEVDLREGIAQLVECMTEKSGIILTWDQVSTVARDFPP